MRKQQSKTAPFGFGLFALFGLLFVVLALSIVFFINPHALESVFSSINTWIIDAGPLGWILIIVLMILHSFVPLPSEFIALAAGMSYGIFLATILVWIGAMLGAVVAFALARWLGEPFVARILNPAYMKKLDHWKANQGIPTLLVSRLIPVISFNLINYAAGLAGVKWWPFLWTTAIGIIPMTVISVSVGATMGSLPLSWFVALSIIGITLVIGVHLWFRKRQK